MQHDHGPEIAIVEVPDMVGADQRAEWARQRNESRVRYTRVVADTLTNLDVDGDAHGNAIAVLHALFTTKDVETGEECRCSCHPRLPDTDLHDYGFDCGCRLTRSQRADRWAEFEAADRAFWDSPEGRRLAAARQTDEDELHAELERMPGVTVTMHGGFAPEQWEGTVDGHSFYFRERHDEWRIELDLRPTGRRYRVLTGGDLDDDAGHAWRESQEGDVIARGTVWDDGYGARPVERIRFIVRTIRDRLGRRDCQVHTDEVLLDGLSRLVALAWCPACGARLSAISL